MVAVVVEGSSLSSSSRHTIYEWEMRVGFCTQYAQNFSQEVFKKQ